MSPRKRRASPAPAHPILHYSALAIFAALVADIGLWFNGVIGPWAQWRHPLTGVLLGLLLIRLLLAAKRYQWKPSLLDGAVLLWVIWEATAPFFARIPFAALEGFRDIVLAFSTYLAGMLLLSAHPRDLPIALFAAVSTQAFVTHIWPNAVPYPAMTLPWAGMAFFGLMTLGGQHPWRRWQKWLLKWLLLMAILCFAAIYATRIHQTRSGSINRQRWQQAFERSQAARPAFFAHPVRGLGRGNFDWYDLALNGRLPIAHPHSWLNPWPHLASAGGIGIGMLLLILILASIHHPPSPDNSSPSLSFYLVGLKQALLLWVICGLIGGFLLHAVGLFISFLLAGLIRGHSLPSSSLPESPQPVSGLESGQGRKTPTPGIPAFGTLVVAPILLGTFAALPEISAILADRASAGRSPIALYRLSMMAHPLSPKPLVEQVDFLVDSYDESPNPSSLRDEISSLGYAAIRRNPLNAVYYLQLYRWLDRVPEDQRQARRLLVLGNQQCPGSFELTMKLAMNYERAKDYRKALDCLDRYDEIQPIGSEMHQLRARYAQLLGEHERVTRIRQRQTGMQTLYLNKP